MTQLEQDVGALASLFANVPWGDESKRRRCQEIADRYKVEDVTPEMMECGRYELNRFIGPAGNNYSDKQAVVKIYHAMREAAR